MHEGPVIPFEDMAGALGFGSYQLLPFGVTWLDNPTLLIGHQTKHPDRKR